MSYDSPFYERLEAQLSDIDNLEEHYRYMIRAHSWRGHHIGTMDRGHGEGPFAPENT
jgi:hypothetical protein